MPIPTIHHNKVGKQVIRATHSTGDDNDSNEQTWDFNDGQYAEMQITFTNLVSTYLSNGWNINAIFDDQIRFDHETKGKISLCIEAVFIDPYIVRHIGPNGESRTEYARDLGTAQRALIQHVHALIGQANLPGQYGQPYFNNNWEHGDLINTPEDILTRVTLTHRVRREQTYTISIHENPEFLALLKKEDQPE